MQPYLGVHPVMSAEQKLKKTALLLVLAAALPVAAQSFSAAVSYGKLPIASQTYAGAPDAEGQQNFGQTSDATVTAYGIHGSWEAVAFGPLALEVTAGYQAPATETLTGSYWATLPGLTPTLGNGSAPAQLRESQVGVGVRLAGHLPLDWGVGLEARSENLRLVSNPGTLSATLTRPWLEGSVGYTFPGPELKPFVAVTMALALSKVASDGSYDTRFVQSMAPKTEVGVRAGIRF